MVEEFQERRDFATELLRATPGVSLPEPEGAFYLFPQLEGVDDSFQFALDLLQDAHVAVAPGSAFGNGGEGSIPHLLRARYGGTEAGDGTDL